MSYTVEKGIPLPPSRCGNRPYTGPTPWSPLSRAMLALEVGDSFLVGVEDQRRVVSRMSHFPPYRFAVRKIDWQSWRVWRVE